jgi:hypothetical protein
MTTASLRSSDSRPAQDLSSAPRLRLLARAARAGAAATRQPAAGEGWPRAGTEHKPDAQATPAATGGGEPVLIAGADAAARSVVRRELAETMPAGTTFVELGTFWEVLARAPHSRMVIVSGDLDELPAESMLHSLGHRYPDLPVVSLAGSPPATP